VTLAPGTRLGPYEIVAPLGAGGMGEVYRATDTKLGRHVAIKVLPRALASDPERMARFEREARVLASLNHPHIAAIFGLEPSGSTGALVMELVEGPTLADRIHQGPIPIDEALPIARQVAEALEYAHDSGVIHRDLKPANLKLRPDGTVKVLDFGLAKALDVDGGEARAADASHSPTLTQLMTGANVIIGTAAYMSPEQAKGKSADRRADIWAFGVVMFEMLTGQGLFQSETASETLAAVMKDDVPWERLPASVPGTVRRLLERCLTRDARQRLQSIGEARIMLERWAANPEEAGPPAAVAEAGSRPRPIRLLPWLIAAAAVAALGVAMSRKPPLPAATEMSIVPWGGERIGLDISYHPMAISPDGRTLAYTIRVEGQLRLRLRRLDTRDDVEIPGAESARNLFFSPDGEWIGFFDSRKMYKVSVRGGTPVELADAGQDRLGTWLDDGTIVYSREVTEPLYRIPESGGEPTALTTLDAAKRERTHRFPCALDGGPWVVFTVQTVESPGGYDDASIDAVSVKTGERRHLFKGARRAVWAPGGFLILARGSDLYAVPVDPRDPRVTQDPVPVLADVSGDASSGASFFSIADDGTLAWIPGGEPEKTREVGWLDRSGRWAPTEIPAGPYLHLILSPSGDRALVLAGPGGGAVDLWVADLRAGGINRLTHGNGGGAAAWIPDGVRIAHSRSDGTGGEVLVVRRLDGAGGERELDRADHPLIVSDVTPDGREVIFSDYGRRAGRIHVAPVDGGSASRELPAEGEGYEQGGRVSPDGRWLAYVTTKTRREEVCVRSFGGSGGSWQVSSGGAGGVRWGRDSRELFFVTGETLMRVPIEARGDELVIGHPEALFEVPPSPTETSFRDYDYDPVSDRFLFTRTPRGVAARREIALSLGWAAHLKERLRTKSNASR
jgi:serine/threonine-protein kinase